MTQRSIYLAGRYARRLEFCEYADQLREDGHTITSRWLSQEEAYSELARRVESSEDTIPKEATLFAEHDIQDIIHADTLICFTETPTSGYGRGGRHVEFGLAKAWHKRIVIVGPVENVFCTLVPHRFDKWSPEVRDFLKKEAEQRYGRTY